MSRSYKKSPVATDGTRQTTKEMKKYANKAVRNYKFELHKGKDNKKDLFKHDPKNEYYNDLRWQKKYPTLKSFYKYWSKYYKRK